MGTSPVSCPLEVEFKFVLFASDAYMYAYLWCTIELNMSIVGGSIPMLKPLFRRYLPPPLSLTSRSQSSSKIRDRGYGPKERTYRIQPAESPYIGDTTQKSFTNVIGGVMDRDKITDFRSEKLNVYDNYLGIVPQTGIMRTMEYKVEEDFERKIETGSKC